MVSKAVRIALATPGLLLLTACPLVEPPTFDAGTFDGGVDEACLDQQTADSGVIVTECDPATGTRCDVRRMQACTWNVITDEGECTCSSQRVALGEACDLRRNNCEPGTSCLFFSTDVDPTCRSVCRFDDGTGCEPLAAATPDHAFACAPVRRGTNNEPTTNFGVCVDVGVTCDPFADACPIDEKCSLLGRVTACAPVGTVGPGGSCSNEACERGSLCVALADAQGNQVPPTCYVPCRAGEVCATGECIDIGLEFGICYGG